MILVDSSIWIDHIAKPDETLTGLLSANQVVTHPFVIGEIAVGQMRRRDEVLAGLETLPSVDVAAHENVMYLIERHQLFGRGIGYVDVHLLAAVRLTPGSMLWTRDRRLAAAARHVNIETHFRR